MPEQHYRYFYDTIYMFQKLSDYYASSNINITKKNSNITKMSYFK